MDSTYGLQMGNITKKCNNESLRNDYIKIMVETVTCWLSSTSFCTNVYI